MHSKTLFPVTVVIAALTLAAPSCGRKTAPPEPGNKSQPTRPSTSAADAKAPTSTAAKLEPEKYCPVDRRKKSGCPRNVSPGIPRLGPEAIAQTIRTTHKNWKRVRFATSKGQHSGLCSDWVRGQVKHRKHTVNFTVRDMITRCTCVPGTGKVMLDAALQHPGITGRKRIKVAGIEANHTETGKWRYLAFWVADRCVVSLDGSAATPEKKFIEAVGIVDLKALQALCRKRRPRS
jgi:hypothetical protein